MNIDPKELLKLRGLLDSYRQEHGMLDTLPGESLNCSCHVGCTGSCNNFCTQGCSSYCDGASGTCWSRSSH